MTDFVDPLFTDIFVNFRDKCYTQTFQIPNEHPLLKLALNPGKLELKHLPGTNGVENGGENPVKRTTCDEILHEYISECALKSNKEYFRFTFKFVLLFRECINKFRAEEVPKEEISRTFCEVCPADQAPDLCNEFITDFMENADFFGLNLDRERLELIEVIQHFCHWLYERNYTTSRLTLLSG